MTKSDLIGIMAKAGDVSKAKADTMFNSLISGVSDALKTRERVVISGFGTFSVRESKARIGRNPKTGESIQIKAKFVPKFVPGKELKGTIAAS